MIKKIALLMVLATTSFIFSMDEVALAEKEFSKSDRTANILRCIITNFPNSHDPREIARFDGVIESTIVTVRSGGIDLATWYEKYPETALALGEKINNMKKKSQQLPQKFAASYVAMQIAQTQFYKLNENVLEITMSKNYGKGFIND